MSYQQQCYTIFTVLFLKLLLVGSSYGQTMSGTYTVDQTGGGDFNTVSAAAAALNNNGVSGNVTININPGTYDEQVYLDTIPGAGDNSRVTFQSSTGDTADVTLEHYDANKDSNFVIYSDRANFVTLKDLTIIGKDPDDDLTGSTIHIYEHVSNWTIENCRIEAYSEPPVTIGSTSIFSSGNELINDITIQENHIISRDGQTGLHAGSFSEVTFTDITVENNLFENGVIGLSSSTINATISNNTIEGGGIQLADFLAPVRGDNIHIHNNELIGSGMFISNADNIFVYDNYMDDENFSGAAFHLAEVSGEVKVYNNYCINYNNGVFINNSGSSESGDRWIYNNYFYVATSGFQLQTDIEWGIYYNTVHMETDNASTAALFIEEYSPSGEIRNNIFANFYEGFAVWYDETVSFDEDYNGLYADGYDFAYDAENSEVIETFQEYRNNTGNGQNSVEADPQFEELGSYVINSLQLSEAGVPVSGITEDIEGNARDMQNPSIGAYEVEVTEDVNITPESLTLSDQTIEAGNVLTINYEVKNTGDADITEEWQDAIYLSEDQNLNHDDIQLESINHNMHLPEGDKYNQSTAVFIPEDISGDYWVLLNVNDNYSIPFEDVADNLLPSAQQLNITPAPRPDLAVTNINVPASANSGEQVTIEWTVENQGDAPTENTWSDYLYASSDESELQNDYIGNEQLFQSLFVTKVQAPSGLAPNESYTSSATVELPMIFSGNRYYKVITDRNEMTNELEANNQEVSDPIQVVQTPLPDLEIEDFSIQNSVFSDNYASYTYTVRNSGNAETLVHTWTDRLVITKHHPDDFEFEFFTPFFGMRVTNTEAHKLLEIQHTGSLEPGESYTVSDSVYVGECVADTFNVWIETDYKDEAYELSTENNASEPHDTIEIMIEPKPDLVVNDVTNQTSDPATGQPIQVQFEVENDGFDLAQDPGGWYDYVFLSQEPEFDAGPVVFLGGYQREDSLDVGESYEVTMSNLIVPDSAEGLHYIYVYTDYSNNICEAPYDDNNVSRSAPVDIDLTPPPDLYVEDIEYIDDAFAGAFADFNYTVVNQGPGVTANDAWSDEIYILESGAGIDNGMKLDRYDHFGILQPDDDYSKWISVQLPPELETGNYQIAVLTDANDDVYEHDYDDNNVSYSNEFHVDRDPSMVSDLSVEDISYTGDAESGNTITVEYEVENLSASTNKSAWKDEIALMNNDVVLQRKMNTVYGGLDEDASYTESVEFKLPHGRSGSLLLRVRTDTAHTVLEYNIDNNTDFLPIDVELSPSPDLEVTNLDYPLTANAGQPLNVSWTVSNEGIGSAEDDFWTDRVYLSKDPVLTSNAIPLEYVTVDPPLHENETYSDTVSPRIPLHIEGDYYVLVKTDDNDQVFENGKVENNVLASSSGIAISRPEPADLMPLQNSISYNNGFVSYTVENLSSNNAQGDWIDAIYLSSDTTWSSDDHKIAEVEIENENLAQNESYTINAEVDMPVVKPADYHFIVRADAFNYIPDENRDNNTQASDSYYLDMIREIEMDSVYEDTFHTDEPENHFRLTRPADTGMIVELTPHSDLISTELFHRKADVPNRLHYDNRHDDPHRAEQTLLVPSENETVEDYILGIGNELTDSEPFDIVAQSAFYSVFDVEPGFGGEYGNVTVLIRGFDFQDSMRFELRNGDDTVTAYEVYVDGPNEAHVHFDLRGNEPGLYDVVAVKLPTGEETLLEDGFEILEEGVFRPYTHVTQPPLRRPGDEFTVQVTYGNSGTVNRYDNWIVVAFFNEDRETDEYHVSYNGSSLDRYLETSDEHNPPDDSGFVEVNGITYFYYWAPLLAPQSEGDLTYNVSTEQTMDDQDLYTYAFVMPQPLSTYSFSGRIEDLHTSATFWEVAASIDNTTDIASPGKRNVDCDEVLSYENMVPRLKEETMDLAEHVHSQVKAGKNMFDRAMDIVGPGSASDVTQEAANEGIKSFGQGNDVDGVVEDAADAAVDEATPGSPGTPFSGPVNDVFDCIDPDPEEPDDPENECCVTRTHPEGWDYQSPRVGSNVPPGCSEHCCRPPCNGPPGNGGNGGGGSTSLLAPKDPNEIVGPKGITEMRFIERDDELIYTIYFENMPEQQVPAQEVIIENPLQEDFRLQDFEMRKLGFGDVVIDLPPVSALDQTYELGPEYDNDNLRVVAGLNVVAHETFWRLTTVDPETGGQITDPAGGFLPPNDTTGIGEGFVEYAIKLDEDVQAGTEINNQAKIFFDLEPPIETNVWSNIVADSDPFSFVQELPTYTDSTRFKVEWEGIDGVPAGAGISGYDIFYAKDDGDYQIWKQNSLQTEAVFEGEMGSTYRFYSRLRTNDGAYEDPPGEYEAMTTLDEDTRIEEEEEFMSDYESDQLTMELFPNPAREEFTIEINLPVTGAVQIEAHSLTGQHMGSLYNGHMDEGINRFSINPGNMDWNEGIYLISLSSDQGRVVEKLILVR